MNVVFENKGGDQSSEILWRDIDWCLKAFKNKTNLILLLYDPPCNGPPLCLSKQKELHLF